MTSLSPAIPPSVPSSPMPPLPLVVAPAIAGRATTSGAPSSPTAPLSARVGSNEVRPAPLSPATRLNHSLTAAGEKRLLEALARRAPAWVTSDGLTIFGLAAQIAAGAFYALASRHPAALLAVIACIAFNWLGDSLDGTLARVRRQGRPRFGFYVDHVVDLLGSAALMIGLALSGFVHPAVAAAMLLGFLLLAAESYLATYTLGRFQLSTGPFGPTELRLLLIAGNLALLHGPWVHLFGHRLLLFDLGGGIAALSMLVTFVVLGARHTAELYRLEPIPEAPVARAAGQAKEPRA